MQQQPKEPIRRQETLCGWGRLKGAEATAVYPDLPNQLPGAVTGAEGSVLARGEGRSYGDASLNAANTSVMFDWLDRVTEFDSVDGTLTCEAGLTLREITRLTLPHGWFLPVTPGTSYPTIGGSFACDVHGKNHHVGGSIARHVEWFELVTAEGELLRVSRDTDQELFNATAGGLGLTGLVYRLCLRLDKVPSAYFDATFVRTGSLEETMSELERGDTDYTHTVAWLDCSAAGERLGRGEVTLGRHAEQGMLPAKLRRSPFRVGGGPLASVPVVSPIPCVNPLTTRVFNEAYYWKRPNPRVRKLTHYVPFYYPLDIVGDWNKVYGKAGFLQYQCVVPFDAGHGLTSRVLRLCQERGHVPALNVLKRFGAGRPLLSFPEPGWTLALDFPMKSGLLPMLDEVDQIVHYHGGRVYLVKDSRLSPGMFRKMYPEFTDWLQVKSVVDPDWRFSSNLSRRLKMHEG